MEEISHNLVNYLLSRQSRKPSLTLIEFLTQKSSHKRKLTIRERSNVGQNQYSRLLNIRKSKIKNLLKSLCKNLRKKGNLSVTVLIKFQVVKETRKNQRKIKTKISPKRTNLQIIPLKPTLRYKPNTHQASKGIQTKNKTWGNKMLILMETLMI